MVARAVNSVGLGMIGGGSPEEALTNWKAAPQMRLSCWKTTCTIMLPPRVDAALAKAPLVMVVDHQRTAIMDKLTWCSRASFAGATVPW